MTLSTLFLPNFTFIRFLHDVVAIFLEVEINIGGLQLAGSTLSQRRAASGVDSIQALVALRQRTLSFPQTMDGLGGEEGGAVGLDDFHLIKVLGKGR
jgi:hypothetical protein